MIEFFFDIEADGLYHEWVADAATSIDCCCAIMVQDGIEYELDEWNGVNGLLSSQEIAYVIGHNIIDYDLPMLAKFSGWGYDILPDRLNNIPVNFVDTMLLSKLLNPDRRPPEGFAEQWKPSYAGERMPGPHSLEVWAFRLGMVKPKLVYGDKMGNVPVEISITQCMADNRITQALYAALKQEAKAQGAKLHKPLKCEQAVRHIISEGVVEGVPFNKELAEGCIIELDGLLKDLAEEVEPQLPARVLPENQRKYPPAKTNRFKKDGNPRVAAEKYFGEALFKADDSWCVKDGNGCVALSEWPEDKLFGDFTEPMSMSNQADIKSWLIEEYKWKPTLWNTKKEADGSKTRTSPKFHQNGKLCENLERIGEAVPIVNCITKWLSYRNRRNVIRSENGTGWLNHPRLAVDGRLPGDADTIGTGTFRFTHRVIANVPRPSSLYGEKMRQLHCAAEGEVLVGWDASQLEDRCKAHYCAILPGGEEYITRLLDPEFDVHEENAKEWGMERGATKNGHYALQYNCREAKLAEVLGVDLDTATEYYNSWWERNHTLQLLGENVERLWCAYNQELLPAIDGRFVPTRMKHSLVNTLLQSCGVIAMKYAMVLWYNQVRIQGIPAQQIIHYHDEAVAMCPPQYAEQVGELGVQSIKKAGEMLNFRVPLLSEFKVGDSWRDIH